MDKKGFTIVEVIVVIVILGVMASFALPKLFAQKEKGIFSEGVSAAQTLFSAQQRYFLDHNPNYDTSALCTALDVSIAPVNFNINCNTAGYVAAVVRKNGPVYTIRTTSAGVYDCPSCSGSLVYLNAQVPH